MLAIVIPYYKLTFFEETLKSLANQTDKRFNVYIGNDYSPENPQEIVAKYQDSISLVYHSFDNNLGSTSLVKQWKRCINLSKGEKWMMILGDDDVLGRDCVAKFYENLYEAENQNCSVIRFATEIIDENGRSNQHIYTHPKIEKSTDFLMRRMNGGTRNSLSENIFKTEIIKKIGFRDFPLAWHTDDLALLEFSNFGNLYTINDAVVYFRVSTLNITGQKDNVEIKNKASFAFYSYLLRHKMALFTNPQIKILQNKMEKVLLNDKKNGKYWLSVFKIYAANLKLKSFIKLIISAVKSYVHKT